MAKHLLCVTFKKMVSIFLRIYTWYGNHTSLINKFKSIKWLIKQLNV